METNLIQIRELQKESWNKFSSGWKKWDSVMMDFIKPMADEIIRLLNPKGNDVVLDVASGTGEPGLTIAAMLNGGKVVITDLADHMLEIANEHASNRGIKNIETIACDVCELPFADSTFDSISCRFGFMFFPDMLMAAKEMTRVLKPGGKIATAVWNGPEKNFWITATMSAISRNMELPLLPVGSPGMFRCAKDGLMAEIFSQAGLKNISQSEIIGNLNAQTADIYWAMMTEVAAPVVAALSKADDITYEKIKNEVYDALNQRFPDGNILIGSSALVIYGEK